MLRSVLKFFLAFVFMVLIITGVFVGGFGVSRLIFSPKIAQVNDGAPAEFQKSMPVFWEAWNIIQRDFYKQPLDMGKMTYGAIAGMVQSLGDPHTAFVEPTIAKRLNQDLEGSFEGIGATVEMRDGRLTIVSPIKNTPADKAGLKPSDVILKVDDTVIQNMTTQEAIGLIRGPRGTKVKLTLQRGRLPSFVVEVTRDKIEVPSVESRMLDGNIAYIKLNEFTTPAPDELHNALKELQAQHPKAIIFDLRGNPGGFLDVSIKVASEFLKSDQVVLIEKFKSGEKREYKTEGSGLATETPLVLLVNEGSASASEIISGALKDYKRATIVGTKTYGKGSVQVSHALSDESQLRVTIAHFFSPLDHEINGVGVTPDIEVPDPTDAQAAQNQDPQLDRAVQFINGGARLDFVRVYWPVFTPRAVVYPN